MKHNESPTLFVRGHYRFCFCVVLVFQFYVTRSEMNLVLLFVSYSLLLCPFLFVLTNTQSQIDYSLLMTTYKKSGCLTSACPTLLAYHSQQQKNKQSKHPRWSIQTPVKCALRLHEPRSTLRRVYTTPRGSHPRICLGLLFRLWQYEESKNKASVTPSNMQCSTHQLRHPQMTSQPTRADAVLTANIQRIIQHSKIRGQKSFLFHSSEWFLMEKRVEEALGKEGKQIRIRRKGTFKTTTNFIVCCNNATLLIIG